MRRRARKFLSRLKSRVSFTQIMKSQNFSETTALNDHFSIIIIPDTQELSRSHPDIFLKATQWIADHVEQLNLQVVLHLGDVVNNGAAEEIQYTRAKAALDLIDNANIPMLITPGNHDYDNMLGTDRDLTLFNHYFGMQRYENRSWFGGIFEEGKAENSYVKLEIAGEPYIFLSLEFGPRDEVIAWADEVLRNNRESKAIIITHCYMYMYGDRAKPGDDHNPKNYPGASGANDGEDMWQKSFKHHANLIAVFSGHQIRENISYRVDSGEHGNSVFQSFQNWQCAEKGGEGRFRIMKIQPSEGKVSLTVFNPLTETVETEPGYTVSVPLQPQPQPHTAPHGGGQSDALQIRFPVSAD